MSQTLANQVNSLVRLSNVIPDHIVDQEVNWFFNKLGIDSKYFTGSIPQDLADHILAIYGAKVVAMARRNLHPDLSFSNVKDDCAVYFHTSNKGMKGATLEKELDDKFLDSKTDLWKLETFRAPGDIADKYMAKLRCYFLKKVKSTSTVSLEHQEIINQIVSTDHRGLLIKSEICNGDECRIVIAYKKLTTSRFFSSLSDLYHYYDLYSTKKYVDPYENGITIVTLHLAKAGNKKEYCSFSNIVGQFIHDVSLLYPIPDSPLHGLFRDGLLSIHEVIFAYCGGIFAQHFFSRLGSDYEALTKLLDSNNVIHMSVLERVRHRLRTSTMREKQIFEVLNAYPTVIKHIYNYFAQYHLVNEQVTISKDAIINYINEQVLNPDENSVFMTVLTFTDSILKTNFFKTTKTALSFRMDPSFLKPTEFPDPLFGMFMVIGSEFRGFHLRFQDIARGGIRIIRSRNSQVYESNMRSLFDENYGLAHTQQRKNKDIPEGGAKGAILMNAGFSKAEEFMAFKKYVSNILDLFENSPEIVDKYGKQEILFFGPDEGTAEYMDWASQTAKRRGFSFWKALTTGKSPSLGGIPHDLYGMTTRSIRQYVLGTLNKLGLQESEITKFQTGGPDGDLGSNEIKISNDKTIGIVDGSGVLYDPEGIDRAELVRLAGKRQMIDHFDITKLSKSGFRVLISDTNIVLPNGQLVSSGLSFRNDFHLNELSTATIFVPCGGRPEAVKINNVSQLYDAKGKPRFKAIIEGANLFFSEQARLKLESDGVILFKDASANKGGVTSSSMEVLAALSLTEEQYMDYMCVPEESGNVPEFRQKYVEEVIQRIELFAKLEFDCLWKEHEITKEPLTILSNKLSVAINQMTTELASSPLWDNEKLRVHILIKAIPVTLQELVPVNELMTRVPIAYLKAIFSSYIASNFVYMNGINPTQLSFFTFMSEQLSKSEK